MADQNYVLNKEDLTQEINHVIAVDDGPLCAGALIAAALLHVAQAIDGLTSSIHRLGTADAATHMGALEMMACELKDGLGGLSTAVSEVGSAMQEIASNISSGTEGTGPV